MSIDELMAKYGNASEIPMEVDDTDGDGKFINLLSTAVSCFPRLHNMMLLYRSLKVSSCCSLSRHLSD